MPKFKLGCYTAVLLRTRRAHDHRTGRCPADAPLHGASWAEVEEWRARGLKGWRAGWAQAGLVRPGFGLG